jgi:hypothetical protein
VHPTEANILDQVQNHVSKQMQQYAGRNLAGAQVNAEVIAVWVVDKRHFPKTWNRLDPSRLGTMSDDHVWNESESPESKPGRE